MVRWFDSLHLCLAVGPLAVYLLIIGYLNLRRRITVVTGFVDTLLLGFAVSGLVLVGPIELFFPEMAAFRMGIWVWPLLLALYFLFVLLAAMSQRPSVIFYNAELDEVHALVMRAAGQLDPEVRRVKDCLVLPARDLQLHANRSPVFRNVQLVSLGEEHNLMAWIALRKQLVTLGRDAKSSPTRTGYALVALAALFLTMLGILSVADQHEIARAFDELLRRN